MRYRLPHQWAGKTRILFQMGFPLSTKGLFHAIIPVLNHLRGCLAWVNRQKNLILVLVCWPMFVQADEIHTKHPLK